MSSSDSGADVRTFQGADRFGLNPVDALELAGLDATQLAELKAQHAAGVIDLKKKADELKIDVHALDAALGVFNDQIIQRKGQARFFGSGISRGCGRLAAG